MTDFRATRSDRRYCSNACRQQAYRRRTQPDYPHLHYKPLPPPTPAVGEGERKALPTAKIRY
ncbi:MAG: hypothetical protein HC915_06620 [Anaerolineae bacterium]|nr:hypothetical protein [Anaerolineae bacterium]